MLVISFLHGLTWIKICIKFDESCGKQNGIYIVNKALKKSYSLFFVVILTHKT